MELEKGKNYLVLDQTKDRNIFEIEVLEDTKTCHKIRFKATVNNVFSLDIFNENTKWVLKTDFEKSWNILEELPKETGRNIVDSILESTKDINIEDLFGGKKEGKKEKKK